ncbi:hypothetical protein HDU76_011578 [Blyttiomyces sp. JEL0837]|nr:hypothetical protein HDU76_011578 [Blyttiomyces sp. JEL0837]
MPPSRPTNKVATAPAGQPTEGSSSAAPVSTVEEAEGEDEGVIRCICGFDDDDGFTIQCDQCQVWQHYACLGLSAVPDQYLCEQCNPRTLDVEKAKLLQARRHAGSVKPAKEKPIEIPKEKEVEVVKAKRKEMTKPSPKKRKESIAELAKYEPKEVLKTKPKSRKEHKDVDRLKEKEKDRGDESNNVNNGVNNTNNSSININSSSSISNNRGKVGTFSPPRKKNKESPVTPSISNQLSKPRAAHYTMSSGAREKHLSAERVVRVGPRGESPEPPPTILPPRRIIHRKTELLPRPKLANAFESDYYIHAHGFNVTSFNLFGSREVEQLFSGICNEFDSSREKDPDGGNSETDRMDVDGAVPDINIKSSSNGRREYCFSEFPVDDLMPMSSSVFKKEVAVVRAVMDEIPNHGSPGSNRRMRHIGLFAVAPIPAHTIIGEFKGRVVCTDELNRVSVLEKMWHSETKPGVATEKSKLFGSPKAYKGLLSSPGYVDRNTLLPVTVVPPGEAYELSAQQQQQQQHQQPMTICPPFVFPYPNDQMKVDGCAVVIDCREDSSTEATRYVRSHCGASSSNDEEPTSLRCNATLRAVILIPDLDSVSCLDDSGWLNNRIRLCLVSTRSINAGEEVVLGSVYEHWKGFPCVCGDDENCLILQAVKKFEADGVDAAAALAANEGGEDDVLSSRAPQDGGFSRDMSREKLVSSDSELDVTSVALDENNKGKRKADGSLARKGDIIRGGKKAWLKDFMSAEKKVVPETEQSKRKIDTVAKSDDDIEAETKKARTDVMETEEVSTGNVKSESPVKVEDETPAPTPAPAVVRKLTLTEFLVKRGMSSTNVGSPIVIEPATPAAPIATPASALPPVLSNEATTPGDDASASNTISDPMNISPVARPTLNVSDLTPVVKPESGSSGLVEKYKAMLNRKKSDISPISDVIASQSVPVTFDMDIDRLSRRSSISTPVPPPSESASSSMKFPTSGIASLYGIGKVERSPIHSPPRSPRLSAVSASIAPEPVSPERRNSFKSSGPKSAEAESERERERGDKPERAERALDGSSTMAGLDRDRNSRTTTAAGAGGRSTHSPPPSSNVSPPYLSFSTSSYAASSTFQASSFTSSSYNQYTSGSGGGERDRADRDRERDQGSRRDLDRERDRDRFLGPSGYSGSSGSGNSSSSSRYSHSPQQPPGKYYDRPQSRNSGNSGGGVSGSMLPPPTSGYEYDRDGSRRFPQPSVPPPTVSISGAATSSSSLTVPASANPPPSTSKPDGEESERAGRTFPDSSESKVSPTHSFAEKTAGKPSASGSDFVSRESSSSRPPQDLPGRDRIGSEPRPPQSGPGGSSSSDRDRDTRPQLSTLLGRVPYRDRDGRERERDPRDRGGYDRDNKRERGGYDRGYDRDNKRERGGYDRGYDREKRERGSYDRGYDRDKRERGGDSSLRERDKDRPLSKDDNGASNSSSRWSGFARESQRDRSQTSPSPTQPQGTSSIPDRERERDKGRDREGTVDSGSQGRDDGRDHMSGSGGYEPPLASTSHSLRHSPQHSFNDHHPYEGRSRLHGRIRHPDDMEEEGEVSEGDESKGGGEDKGGRGDKRSPPSSTANPRYGSSSGAPRGDNRRHSGPHGAISPDRNRRDRTDSDERYRSWDRHRDPPPFGRGSFERPPASKSGSYGGSSSMSGNGPSGGTGVGRGGRPAVIDRLGERDRDRDDKHERGYDRERERERGYDRDRDKRGGTDMGRLTPPLRSGGNNNDA